VCHEDVQKAIQLAIWYDRHERDDAKRERYVKLIGNALRSDHQIQDVSSFVQTIEQLNERDVIVLKVLKKIMNKNRLAKRHKIRVRSTVGDPKTAKSKAPVPVIARVGRQPHWEKRRCFTSAFARAGFHWSAAQFP
jgi:hypothetical protein